MRKIIVGAQVSMDGVMQAPGGPTEDPTKGFKFGGWAMPYFDQEFGEELGRLFSEKFDLLLGRKTYEIFAAYWPYYDADARPRRHREALQRDQEVRGFALGRSRYELARLGAPARHCRRQAPAERRRPQSCHPRQHRTRPCAPGQRPRRRDDPLHRPGRARRRQKAVCRRLGSARLQADQIARFEHGHHDRTLRARR